MNAIAKKQIERGLSKLVILAPAYAALALSLKPKETDQVPFMATDGVHLLYNPDGIKDWSDAETVGVIAHETEHCARQHMLRRGDRDHKNWNMACDYVVNESVKASGLTLPSGCLDGFHGDYEESIYNKLPSNPKGGSGNGNGSGKDNPGNSGDFGQVLDAPGTAEDQKQLKEEWEQWVITAAQVAKSQGSCPGFMERALGEFKNPKVDWRHQLSAFFTAKAKNDYSWHRPNRRYLSSGFILPSLHSNTLGTVVLVRDTSGSTYEHQSEFLDHVQSVLDSCKPERVIFMDCDYDVSGYRELHAGERIERKSTGGGGTSFCAPFKRLEKEGITPDCLVYLTDLYGGFPSDPGYPVLWAATTNESVPFGDVIRLKE